MNGLYSILILLASVGMSYAQISYHPIVQQAKETSYYSEGLDWKSINTQFVSLIGKGETVDELKTGLQFLVNSLNDKHAGFRSAKDHSLVVSYTGKREPDSRKSEFVNTVINDIEKRFSFQKLANDVGYLKVVAIGGKYSVEEDSKFIRDGLKELAAQGTKKWVLDLRFNGGGNINPMISGLAPLIGEGFIGGSVDAKEELSHVYQIKDGQFYDSERLACEMDNLPKINSSDKVVVLLSRYTISSGEMLAVAFKGRPNTHFIGESTAGYTTGNGYDQVTDDLFMVISQSVFADRDKQIYKNKVGVDEEMDFQHQLELDGDKQVERAMEWLDKE